MGVPEVRDRLAELSASAWTHAAIGAAVELGLPASMREPSQAPLLAEAAGVSVPLATSLAEALVAGGLAQRTDRGFVAVPGLAALAVDEPQDVMRADLRSGLLQMAALYDEATRAADLLRDAGFEDVTLMDRLASGLVPMRARRA